MLDVCAPIGTAQERASGKIWPGNWENVNGYARHYEIRPGVWSWHTGADLNLNKPFFDADAHSGVYSIALGVVAYRGWPQGSKSGNVIIIDYKDVVARYWHIDEPLVKAGDIVAPGQQIASVGNAGGWFPYHLHFDLSLQRFLITNPTDWPGTEAGVKAKYIDPEKWLREHVKGGLPVGEKLTVTAVNGLGLYVNPARPIIPKGGEIMGYEQQKIGDATWRRVQLVDTDDDGWLLEADKGGTYLVSVEKGEPHEVAVNKLNVRKGAGTTNAIVGSYTKGQVVTVTGHYMGTGAREWARITEGPLAGNYVARVDSVGTVCLVPK